MERILKEINAAYAYERGITGRGVGVAVLDTGIALHPDLKDRVSYFRDYVNERSEPYDDNGHGTHIGGIIGAKNGTALHEVAPDCNILGCKILDRNGNGKIEHACLAVEKLMEQNRYHRGLVRIINISVGMTDDVRPRM